MAANITANIVESMVDGQARLIIAGLPDTAFGRNAKLKLELKVKVKKSRGVDSSLTLQEHDFQVTGPQIEVDLGDALQRVYGYTGKRIDIDLNTHITIDDGILFDTQLHTEIERQLLRSPPPSVDADTLIEPPDKYNFRANLRAIPARNRMFVIVLSLASTLFIAVNSLLGVHDEFSPSSNVYFYDHIGSDGSESPMMKSLAGSGGLGLVLWLAIRTQLRKYMKFELRPAARLPRRGTRLVVRDLVHGVSRVALEKAQLRIVAVNLERGQYKDGSGTKERTVSFANPVRGVLLYEQYLPYVPAHSPLETYLEGEVDFELMFETLFPPVSIGSNHGIGLRWEIQLIHPQFVDQELIGDNGALEFEDFIPNAARPAA